MQLQQVPQPSLDFYRHQQQIAAATVSSAAKLWRRMGSDFDSSWMMLRPDILHVVHVGRAAAVTSASQYTPALLAATVQVAPAQGSLNSARFLASAPDGRDMGTLLDESVIRAKVGVARGVSSTGAIESIGAWLTGMLLTVMADTRRAVVGADIVQRPAIAGYTRMLNAPSCSRCVILAGRWFRWNAGFQRHPRCDCIHVMSTSEAFARDQGFVSDPYEYFKSLTTEQQDKMFRPHGVSREKAAQIGKSNARAIRDGADVFRIENVRLRGLATAKGNLRYGTPSRMTVDDIYRTAGTRTNAIRLMEREGYITSAGQVPGGAILGQREGFGALGKGGNARAASDAVTDARAGVRDPLNRYTMTSAERRLYDANYRLSEARATGNWPRSIGENSADKYSKPRALEPGELQTLEGALQNELKRVRGDTLRGIAPAGDSVQKLARLLGL